jgi:putative NADH-flavin reductase
MKIVIFGAGGLIGDDILQNCLQADDVTEVVMVGRAPLRLEHPKLRHVVHGNFLDFVPITQDVTGADASFWAAPLSCSQRSSWEPRWAERGFEHPFVVTQVYVQQADAWTLAPMSFTQLVKH